MQLLTLQKKILGPVHLLPKTDKWDYLQSPIIDFFFSFLVLTSVNFLEALGSGIGTCSIFAIHFHFRTMCCFIQIGYLHNFFSNRAQSHIQTKPVKWEIDFQTFWRMHIALFKLLKSFLQASECKKQFSFQNLMPKMTVLLLWVSQDVSFKWREIHQTRSRVRIRLVRILWCW
jgi:hypothetical protein